MTSNPEKQITAMFISANISRSKGSETIKFAQIIKQNEKIFSWKKCGGKISARYFSKR